jgi:hypothetical protein
VSNTFKSPFTLATLSTIGWLILTYGIYSLDILIVRLGPIAKILLLGSCILLNAFAIGYFYSFYFKEPIPNALRSNTAYLTTIQNLSILLIINGLRIPIPQAIDIPLAHYGQTVEHIADHVTQGGTTTQVQVQEKVNSLTSNGIKNIVLALGSLALIGLTFWLSVWLIYQCLGLGSRLYFYHKQL